MDKIFPHPPYAEDQPHSHIILPLHVIRAGLTVGSILSVVSATIFTAAKQPRTVSVYTTRLITYASRGSVAGMLAGAGMVTFKMRGREEIEWQDRAWRLLENKGQMEMDRWVPAGGVLGAVACVVAARRGKVPSLGTGTAALGGLGLGVAGGAAGYAGWRYGVHGGRFD
ncbi:uncharacterized protein CIMG_02692 [Coccidioides immitis RS]|uniref:Uncharacterized protein n=2 Tax=Coccidioides immitis TaxID=5501 RepID=J3KLW9_COCIM|nr:uncharacterized protein CIMG_02692 [Coccidioides immitis RS]EAS37338.3 hypothetical protein CIMG_02692 [Coccidioides immitis RS]KMU89329.1 hypothetical protein CIHG_07002 [Coccidioides immitis H538.4]TPX24702.1 hypothetical protein DIZ76_010137 [Coccidioides immitis]